MAWNLASDRPIYTQIVEIIQTQIVSGFYAPGDKIPSVRDLAATANVNPNTMQRALTDLERIGLVVTNRTNGRTVTEDTQMIKDVQRELATEQIKNFFSRMKELGYTEQDIVTFVKEVLEEGK